MLIQMSTVHLRTSFPCGLTLFFLHPQYDSCFTSQTKEEVPDCSLEGTTEQRIKPHRVSDICKSFWTFTKTHRIIEMFPYIALHV